jgi:hypothetical protein
MSKLSDVQDHLVSLLTSDPFFSGSVDNKPVAVLAQRKGNIQSAVAEKLQTVGVGVIVRQPIGDFNGEGPRHSYALSLVLAITENVTNNKTGKSADDIWEKAVQLIHWKPNSATANRLSDSNRFKVAKQALTPAVPNPGSLYVGYFLKISTTIVLP